MTWSAQNADMFKVLVSAGELILSVCIAVAGGMWTFQQWLVQRRDEMAKQQAQREAEVQQSRLRLEQERAAAEQRRVERAAELVLSFGKAGDPDSRMWAAMALSLYPDHTLPLLAMALGKIDDAGASGVETALAALGVQSLAELAKMNRLAVSLRGILADTETPPSPAAAPESKEDDLTISAERQLARTKRVINQILLHADESELAKIDLEGVDLTRALFRSAKLKGANLRKVNLTDADFARARLRETVLRGATLTGAVFTRANAMKADFTGAIGPAGFIKLEAEGAIFKQCHFSGSNFDGADLSSADMDGADFSQARMNGAQLHHAQLVKTNLNGLIAHSARFNGATVSHARLAHTDLANSTWKGTNVDNSVMTAIDLSGATLENGSIVNCNLGGARLSKTTIKHFRFDRCHFGGAKFTGARIEDCVFQDCQFAAAEFDGAVLRSVAFAGRCEVAGRPVSFAGAEMENVTFSDASSALKAGS